MSGSRPAPAGPADPAGFHATFNCLWCGRPHKTRTDQDLEGWAMLCPDCVGRAQDNEFLRFRLREGLKRRTGAVPSAPITAGPPPATSSPTAPTDNSELDDAMRAYYAARTPEYDDIYLRRGRYDKGPIFKLSWDADLDAATTWLDQLPIHGEIVELAAGTGWWSPILATKGELSLYDANEEPLELARQRLVAHGLRAHLHVRDAWAEPDRQVDAVFAGFWISHVTRDRLSSHLQLMRRWLKPGGIYAFIDGLPDTGSGAADHGRPKDDLQVRRLNDGREFTIPKVYYSVAELQEALHGNGFATAEVQTTSKFFMLGQAVAAEVTEVSR